jgi:hypothetical protein
LEEHGTATVPFCFAQFILREFAAMRFVAASAG